MNEYFKQIERLNNKEVKKICEYFEKILPDNLGRNYKFIATNTYKYFDLEQNGLSLEIFEEFEQNKNGTYNFKGNIIRIEPYEHYLKVKPYFEMYIFNNMLSQTMENKNKTESKRVKI